MKKPKGFVLYPNQLRILQHLTAKEVGEVFLAIYRKLSEQPTELELLSGRARVAYESLMLQIDVDIGKYEHAAEMHRERQRRYVFKQKLTEDSQVLTDANDARNRNKKIEIEKESEKENENENEKENEKENESSSRAAEGNSDVSEFGSAAWQRNFIAFFNRCIEGSNIPCIRTLTPKRIELLRRLREAIKANPGQMRTTEIVFKQAARSDFLNGRGRKNKFQATFDWLIQIENYIHVMEGNYP